MQDLFELVKSDCFNPYAIFNEDGTSLIEIKTTLADITSELPKETIARYLITKLAPAIFTVTNDAIRDKLILVALHWAETLKFRDLPEKEQESILTIIEQKYIIGVSALQANKNPQWDQVWVFLLRFLETYINGKASTTNKLLKIVETAFRQSDNEQRLKAYDCWRHFIDVSSLDMKNICSNRQIKLLLTPLRPKIAKTTIDKSTDVFIYLLEKLKENATPCLQSYFELAFGPFTADCVIDKMAKPEYYEKNTIVLMQIMAHYRHNFSCLTLPDYLTKSLIDNSNFNSFSTILIKSATVCCLWLKNWNNNDDYSRSIVKCIWSSIIQMVTETDEAEIWNVVNEHLQIILQASEKDQYLVFEQIMLVLLEYKAVDKTGTVVFEACLNMINSKQVKTHGLDKFTLLDIIDSLVNPQTSKVTEEFSQTLLSLFTETTHYKTTTLYTLWKKYDIDAITKSHVALTWPIKNYHALKCHIEFDAVWFKLYFKECESLESKLALLQEMKKIFLENPLSASNIIHFIQVISNKTKSQNNKKNSSAFVLKFALVINSVLTYPNLVKTDIGKLRSVILDCFQFCLVDVNIYQDKEVVELLFKCMESIIARGDHSILLKLGPVIKNLKPERLEKVSSILMPHLESLQNRSDEQIAPKVQTIMKLLSPKAETNNATPSRSTKMINLLNGNTSKLESPRSPKKSSRKSIPLHDEKSSDFVVIDTVVKFETSKLNEHQKEVLKRRRDDIPALYEDLSQSQTITESSNDTQPPQKNVESSVNETPVILETVVVEETPEIAATNNNKPQQSEEVKGETIDHVVQSLTLLLDETAMQAVASEVKDELLEQDSNQETKPEIENKDLNVSTTKRIKRVYTKTIRSTRSTTGDKVDKSPVLSVESENVIEPTPTPPVIEAEVPKRRKHERKSTGDMATRRQSCRASTKVIRYSPSIMEKPTNIPVKVNQVPDTSTPIAPERKPSTRRSSATKTEPVTADSPFTPVCSEVPPQTTPIVSERKPITRRSSATKTEPMTVDTPVSGEIPPQSTESEDIIESSQAPKLDVQNLPLSLSPVVQLSPIVMPPITNSKALTFEEEETPVKSSQSEMFPDSGTTPISGKTNKRVTPPTRSSPRNKNAEADTQTLEVSTPVVENLPGSPLMCDTPDRAAELLDSTLNISPIDEKVSVASLQLSNRELKNERVARLLLMVNPSVSSSSSGSSGAKPLYSTPNNKTKRMAMRKESVLELGMNCPSTKMMRTSFLHSPRSRVRKMSMKQKDNLDVLTFSREIPSPLTVPLNGILKRKFIQSEDGATPPAKRKRVNFSDPAITDQKVFLKDTEDEDTEEQEEPSLMDTLTLPIEDSVIDCNSDTEILGTFRELMRKIKQKNYSITDLSNLFKSTLEPEEVNTVMREFSTSENAKSTVLNLANNLKTCEIAEIASECLVNLDEDAVKEVGNSLEANAKKRILEKFLPVMSSKADILGLLLEKLRTGIEDLSGNKIVAFVKEVIEICGDDTIRGCLVEDASLMAGKVQEHIVKYEPEEMTAFIQNYSGDLNDEKRERFLIDLLKMSSNRLPMTKKIMETHVELLQNFVQRMTDA